jgi:hypothetical protein
MAGYVAVMHREFNGKIACKIVIWELEAIQ